MGARSAAFLFVRASSGRGGAGYALLQVFLKPPLGTLLKRLLLAATFLTWAVVQVLPPSRTATLLSDAVVAAYVLDLYWLMEEQIVSCKTASSKDVPGKPPARLTQA